MNIDLFKLNNFGYVELDNELDFSNFDFGTSGVRRIENAYIDGELRINYEDDLDINFHIKGTFILPCSITLEDVSFEFDVIIEENLGKFDDFYDKKKKSLDILPIIWENIVSEVPIRVVKDGISYESLKGDGWELISSD